MTTTEQWERINRLFYRALDVAPAKRAAFLRRECGGDEELRREVGSLLASHEQPVPFLDVPALGPSFAVDADADPLLGRRIGPYRLDRQIGAGGMGQVYLASRQDGLLDRTVAIKVIQGWRGSGAYLERFQREGQALATLDHPHIARLFDAGVTGDGLPYLIMEHIEGRHIDAFCDEERLGLEARIRLFGSVARAVHTAHQSLVIHRDLKPANILVTADGVPKLLDFGIAKILHPDGEAAEPAATDTLGAVMTPDYASPEQIRGEPVTTATDVYSLGVVLYELLCGRRPYAPTSNRLEQLERIAGEVEPVKPSTHAVEGIARQRRLSPRRLRRRLRGDLDNIAMMAMRKEPSRRYLSAQQLADELDRYLAGLPVVARPDTVLYRARKFVRRNRLAVGAAAVVAVAVAAGVAATAWQARVAADERDLANAAREQAAAQAEHAGIEAKSAQQLAELTIDAFLVSAPRRSPEDLEATRALLERQVERVRREYAAQTHLRANLLDALGGIYLHLDLYGRADELIREAAHIREAEFGERSIEVALSFNSLGESRFRQGDYEGAATSFRKALELQRALPVGVHTDVARAANNLAVALRALGQLDEAEALHVEALALRRRHLGDSNPLVAESLNNLAAIRLARGDLESAEEQVRQALEIRRASLGDHHPLVGQTLNNLAAIVFRSGDVDAAADIVREAVEVYRSLEGTDPDGLASTLTNYAELLRMQGKMAAARDAVDEALRLHMRRGEDHPKVATTLLVLANLEHALGRDAEASRHSGEAVRIRRAVLPAGHPGIALALNDRGKILLESGDPAAAEPLLREAVEIFGTAGSEPSFLATARSNLGACLLDRQQFAEAEALLLAAHRELGAAGGARAERTAQHLHRLYEAWGKPAEAARFAPGK